MFSKISFVLALFSFTTAIRNSIYIISEAETPSLGLDGLTPVGLKRASECIPSVFRPLNIGLIISCTPDPVTGACYSSVATAKPLADSLGLAIDTTCGTGEDDEEELPGEVEDDCVPTLINDWAANNTKAILIVWDIAEQDTLLENLDVEAPGDVEDWGTFHDVITTIRNEQWIGQTSQNCATIDGQAPGTGIFSRISGRRGLKNQKKRSTKRK